MKQIKKIIKILGFIVLSVFFAWTIYLYIVIQDDIEYQKRKPTVTAEECKDVPRNDRDYAKATGEDLRDLPLNVAGLICSGKAKDCRIVDTCNNLVGIVCKRSRPKYIFANKNSKKIVTCSKDDGSCESIVPQEWSCNSPRNMPLSISEQKKHPKYKVSISCGDVLGVRADDEMNSVNVGSKRFSTISDGTYRFISKKSGKIIETCSFWKSRKTQSPCKPPRQWKCGFPSNYN